MTLAIPTIPGLISGAAASVCPLVDFYQLSGGRIIMVNSTIAQQYGEVLGHFSAIHPECLSGIVNTTALVNATAYMYDNYHPNVTAAESPATPKAILGVRAMSVETIRISKRIFSWATAQAFFKAIGYAGTFINVACQVYDWITGGNVQGSMPCTLGPVLTTLSGTFYLLDGVKTYGGTIVRDYFTAEFTNLATYQPGYGSMGYRRSENHVLPILGADGLTNITLLDYVQANSSHPLHFLGPQGHVLKVWHGLHPHDNSSILSHVGYQFVNSTNVKRDPSCWTSEQEQQMDNGAVIEECGDFNGDTAYGPTEMYYGFDAYNGDQMDALSYDIGTEGANNNGFGQLANDIASVMDQHYIWDACLCFQENSQWVMTGALQASWNGGYNGYSACWASQCDGAT
jgi:hypothetical protein